MYFIKRQQTIMQRSAFSIGYFWVWGTPPSLIGYEAIYFILFIQSYHSVDVIVILHRVGVKIKRDNICNMHGTILKCSKHYKRILLSISLYLWLIPVLLNLGQQWRENWCANNHHRQKQISIIWGTIEAIWIKKNNRKKKVCQNSKYMQGLAQITPLFYYKISYYEIISR